MKETFGQFKSRVDAIISSRAGGFDSDDFCDAPWYDLYEETADMRGPEFETAVIETMAEADDLFAAMMEAQGD